ncbi:S8 family serine peptidase, partial [Candidatus Bathyarchaeota archaeon]|nr:S8 family serine peptidase [Candidatus Bathyarchaeota archaeon]
MKTRHKKKILGISLLCLLNLSIFNQFMNGVVTASQNHENGSETIIHFNVNELNTFKPLRLVLEIAESSDSLNVEHFFSNFDGLSFRLLGNDFLSIILNPGWKRSFFYELEQSRLFSGVWLDSGIKLSNGVEFPAYAQKDIKPSNGGNQTEIYYPVETDFESMINDSHDLGYMGNHTLVAIIDSGINMFHPDLDDLDDNPDTYDPKVIGSVSFTEFDPYYFDFFGHGTYIAGIVAGTGELNASHRGIAPSVRLLNVKVFDIDGFTYYSWAISGLYWSLNHGADIALLAWSTFGFSGDPLCEAINDVTNQGMLVIASAGDEVPGYMTISSPGSAEGALTVGSYIPSNGSIYSISGRGPTLNLITKPDVLGPGEDIVGTSGNLTAALLESSQSASSASSLDGIFENLGLTLALSSGFGEPINENYTRATTTDAAAAWVAGVASILLHRSRYLTPLSLKILLMNTAHDLNEPANKQGAGIVNLTKALMEVESHTPRASSGNVAPILPNTGTIMASYGNVNLFATNFGTQLFFGFKALPSYTILVENNGTEDLSQEISINITLVDGYEEAIEKVEVYYSDQEPIDCFEGCPYEDNNTYLNHSEIFIDVVRDTETVINATFTFFLRNGSIFDQVTIPLVWVQDPISNFSGGTNPSISVFNPEVIITYNEKQVVNQTNPIEIAINWTEDTNPNKIPSSVALEINGSTAQNWTVNQSMTSFTGSYNLTSLAESDYVLNVSILDSNSSYYQVEFNCTFVSNISMNPEQVNVSQEGTDDTVGFWLNYTQYAGIGEEAPCSLYWTNMSGSDAPGIDYVVVSLNGEGHVNSTSGINATGGNFLDPLNLTGNGIHEFVWKWSSNETTLNLSLAFHHSNHSVFQTVSISVDTVNTSLQSIYYCAPTSEPRYKIEYTPAMLKGPSETSKNFTLNITTRDGTELQLNEIIGLLEFFNGTENKWDLVDNFSISNKTQFIGEQVHPWVVSINTSKYGTQDQNLFHWSVEIWVNDTNALPNDSIYLFKREVESVLLIQDNNSLSQKGSPDFVFTYWTNITWGSSYSVNLSWG